MLVIAVMMIVVMLVILVMIVVAPGLLGERMLAVVIGAIPAHLLRRDSEYSMKTSFSLGTEHPKTA